MPTRIVPVNLRPTPWLRFNVGYADDPKLYRFMAQEAKRLRSKAKADPA